ncbi:hypothetical protein ACLB2K_017827 [Fragaria x ananassa]
MATTISISPWKLGSLPTMSLPPSTTSRFPKPAKCSPIKQEPEVDSSAAILCEPFNGRGWLVCDFCKGQKTNVKSESNRTYRRCPSCRAVSLIFKLGMCCVQSAKSSNVSHSQITMMVKSCPFEIFVFPFSGSLFTIHRNSLMKWEKPFIHPCYLSVPLIFPMKS